MESGRLSADLVDVVNGKVLVANTADIDDDNIYAHVKTEINGGAIYSSLEVALAEAAPGDVIELNRTYVLYADKELTIPAGVTVDATASDDRVINFIVISSDLTVDGKLIVDGFKFVASTDDTKEIVVNGFLMAENPGAAATEKKWFTPIGVSFVQTLLDSDGDEVEYFVITNLSNIQQAIDLSDEKEVTVEGKAKIENISVSGGEGEMAEITFDKEVNAGTITIDNVKLIFTDKKKIDATIADSQGSIVLKGAYADDGLEIFSEGNGVYMTGEVTDTDDASYSIYFYGKTGMKDARIAWGHYTDSSNRVYPTIVFVGDTLTTGKKNEIKPVGNYEVAEGSFYDIISIIGSLTADGSSRLIIDCDVEALGSLVAMGKSDRSTAGAIDIAGNLFLGTTMAAIYNADDVVAAGPHTRAPSTFGAPGTDAAAVLSGKVTIDGYLASITGSAIDDSIVEDFDYIDFYVDDSLWLTIYRGENVGATFYLDGLKAPVFNAKVAKIVDQDDIEIAKYNDNQNVVSESIKPVIFGTTTQVYFNAKYDVFTVYIKTDASIKSVYLDGILMQNELVENTFYLNNQLAGAHTVAVEPAAGYIADNAYLYDDYGVSLPGMTFSFDREDCVVNEDGSYSFYIYYNVAGTELTPSEVIVKNDWDVTTILLLVIVVIIAIMAVMVAMRLNRS